MTFWIPAYESAGVIECWTCHGSRDVPNMLDDRLTERCTTCKGYGRLDSHFPPSDPVHSP